MSELQFRIPSVELPSRLQLCINRRYGADRVQSLDVCYN